MRFFQSFLNLMLSNIIESKNVKSFPFRTLSDSICIFYFVSKTQLVNLKIDFKRLLVKECVNILFEIYGKIS